MRALLDFAVPYFNEHSLIAAAAFVLLFLSIAAVVWAKLTALVREVWRSIRASIREVLDFRDELRRRRESPEGGP